MFKKELKVNGEIIKGNIIGNWSTKSQYALKIKELNPLTLGLDDLDKVINELTMIKEKVEELNNEYENGK